jgi:hypothetical protein
MHRIREQVESSHRRSHICFAAPEKSGSPPPSEKIPAEKIPPFDSSNSALTTKTTPSPFRFFQISLKFYIVH